MKKNDPRMFNVEHLETIFHAIQQRAVRGKEATAVMIPRSKVGPEGQLLAQGGEAVVRPREAAGLLNLRVYILDGLTEFQFIVGEMDLNLAHQLLNEYDALEVNGHRPIALLVDPVGWVEIQEEVNAVSVRRGNAQPATTFAGLPVVFRTLGTTWALSPDELTQA